MLVIPDFATEKESSRTHPWSVTEYTEDGGAYYDFIQHPALIPRVLEDFRPHAHLQAVQHFYRFLEWTNGPESVLETNDCALRPAIKNDGFINGELRIGGRVEILFRNHALNVDLGCIQWMWRMFYLYLQVNRPNFQEAVFEVAAVPTDYARLPENRCQGQRLRFTFNAYGDSEDEAFDRLYHVFDSLWESARRVSDATKVPIPAFP